MAKKITTGKKATTSKTKGADITIGAANTEYLKALKDEGKNERTIEVYGRCLGLASDYFGPDRPLGKLTPAAIGAFFKSDAILKKPNGKIKSEITVVQNKRVWRLMLVWANEMGYIADVPLPKSEMKGMLAQKNIEMNETGGQMDNESSEAEG